MRHTVLLLIEKEVIIRRLNNLSKVSWGLFTLAPKLMWFLMHTCLILSWKSHKPQLIYFFPWALKKIVGAHTLKADANKSQFTIRLCSMNPFLNPWLILFNSAWWKNTKGVRFPREYKNYLICESLHLKDIWPFHFSSFHIWIK